MCEKKTMQTRPGMNQRRVAASSAPPCSQELTVPAKKMISVMKTMLIEIFINKDEEAMVVFSPVSSLLLT